ncbi:hypothetical protein [Pelagicoccus sp. SDUM812005]|uniref:hypothetical protein n=1 Tax=Pelagicoccus sp. SDUM812005 TaxID=3041257 RepID=UPI00280F7F98|nr:hypothetical protein [Pelagicoccus sp. SDUM812005]MDQ8181708.1 hypothetical protein [Pelagicoccus sp. SDUM812005]
MTSLSPKLKFGLAIALALSVIVALLVLFGNQENPKQVSLQRLEKLEVHIAAFVEANKRAPANLAELGLPAELLQDHMGEPFKYIVSDESVTVLSYGSDKQPGGSFFKGDYSVTIELP